MNEPIFETQEECDSWHDAHVCVNCSARCESLTAEYMCSECQAAYTASK